MNTQAPITPIPNPMVNITLVVDRSGSMQPMTNDVIGGINTFYKQQRELSKDATVTYIQFDDKIEYVFKNLPLEQVKDLNGSTYSTRGWTSLNDAIGFAIAGIDPNTENAQIIVVMTDGQENSSKEYSAAQVKTLVEMAKSKNWQVLFLGANIDSFAVGDAYGVAANNITNFAASSVGVSAAIHTFSSKTVGMRSAYANATQDWASAGGTLSDIYTSTTK